MPIIFEIIKLIAKFIQVRQDFFCAKIQKGCKILVNSTKTSICNRTRTISFKDPFTGEPRISSEPTIEIRCNETFNLDKPMFNEYIFDISIPGINKGTGFGIRSTESLNFELPSLGSQHGYTTASSDRFIFYSDGEVDMRRHISTKSKKLLRKKKLHEFCITYCRMVITTNRREKYIIWYVRKNGKEIEAWKFKIYKECFNKTFCAIVCAPYNSLIKLVSHTLL